MAHVIGVSTSEDLRAGIAADRYRPAGGRSQGGRPATDRLTRRELVQTLTIANGERLDRSLATRQPAHPATVRRPTNSCDESASDGILVHLANAR